MTYYIHHIPGRLRIRSPELKHGNGTGSRVVGLLGGLAGIGSVAVNSVTGSCLVHYDPSKTCHNDIVALLAREGYFDPAAALTCEEYVRNATTRAISFLFPLVLTIAGEALPPN